MKWWSTDDSMMIKWCLKFKWLVMMMQWFNNDLKMGNYNEMMFNDDWWWMMLMIDTAHTLFCKGTSADWGLHQFGSCCWLVNVVELALCWRWSWSNPKITYKARMLQTKRCARRRIVIRKSAKVFRQNSDVYNSKYCTLYIHDGQPLSTSTGWWFQHLKICVNQPSQSH